MAGGFSFPPPPPPPPKPAQQSQQPDYEYSQQSSRGGRGRGGFDTRGRGSGRGRGRGNPNFESTIHSNPQSGSASTQWQNSHQGPQTFQTNAQRPPPGSYINPNFTGQRQYGNANATSTHTQSNDGPARNQAGHKRKLDALRGPQQPREKKPGPQTAPSVPSFGASIFPTAASAEPARTPSNVPAPRSGPSTRPGSKALGLTPQDGGPPAYPSDSEDEDVDEEAQFAELGTKLTFEHNGEVMTLNNEADLAAWKEERRKQFPTNDRVSQKETERLRVGAERKRLLAAVAKLHQAPRNRHVEAKTRSLREPAKQHDEARQEPLATNLEQSEKAAGPSDTVSSHEPSKVAAVTNDTSMIEVIDENDQRPAVADAESNAITGTQQSTSDEPMQDVPKVLPGIDMDETDDEGDAQEATAESPESEAESSDSDSDDSGPPEQVSSKPLASAAPGAPRQLCRYFSASGRCRDGDACRYRHELSSKAPSARPAQPQQDKPAFDRYAPKLDPKKDERKTIFERLLEQEQQGDDRLALQVIKALGQAGFFEESGIKHDGSQ